MHEEKELANLIIYIYIYCIYIFGVTLFLKSHQFLYTCTKLGLLLCGLKERGLNDHHFHT